MCTSSQEKFHVTGLFEIINMEVCCKQLYSANFRFGIMTNVRGGGRVFSFTNCPRSEMAKKYCPLQTYLQNIKTA